jgi:periplasmic protein TonB
MFDDLVECSPSGKKKTKQGTTLIASMGIQVGLLALMLIIPLLVTPALPKSFLATMLTAPPPPAAPPPPPPAAPVVHVKPMAHLIEAGKLMAPKSIPKEVNIIKEDAPPPDLGAATTVTGGVVGGVPGGQIGGVLGGIIGGVSTAAPPPPPPPPVATPTRITKGGDVMMATAINKVQPVYPQLARQSRTEGTVRLHTLIDKDGKVIEVTYVSGPAMLVQSAIDAVRQWRFHPTMLNNTPVQVECVFDLNFRLGGS